MNPSERLSTKLSKFRPSLTLALKRLVQERVANNLPVFDFGLGETKGPLDIEIRDAGERAFREEHTMYTDPAGLLELRAAVLKWLNLESHYGPENVIVSAGAKQSLFNIFLALCNPADCVLFDACPWVSYQPLATAAYAFPVQVLPIKNQDLTLKVTADDLKRNLDMRPHAKLFLLNSPVNPTAQIYSSEEVNSLLGVCAERHVFFVLDRLYWRIVFDGMTYPEPRIDAQTRPWLIQVDGLSKNFRRTGGLRIGWCVAPSDVADAMANLQSHYTAGPATPTQRAALAAITAPYSSDMVVELQAKRDLLRLEAQDMPWVDVWRTPASFYSFWDVRKTFGKKTPQGGTICSSDDLARYLLTEAGVVTASGSGFMQDGYLRLSFATPEDQIIGGMLATRQALSLLA
jgi:aspartate aminotransferase